MVIGFIGAGKMARALAGGVMRGRSSRAPDLLVSSRTLESGQAFIKLFPAKAPRWMADNVDLVRQSDIVILAVKPQQFADVLPPLREVAPGKRFISLAAGITIAQMQSWLGPDAVIIRAMPNMPMQIGQGATAFAVGANADWIDCSLPGSILSAAGKSWEVDEAQIDAVTALSGSGPAYVFHFIEALTRAGVKRGLGEKLARELAIQTVSGSAQLAANSTLTPLELAAQVKSPRGTTLAGCAVLEENDALDTLMDRALAAAQARAEALARGEE